MIDWNERAAAQENEWATRKWKSLIFIWLARFHFSRRVGWFGFLFFVGYGRGHPPMLRKRERTNQNQPLSLRMEWRNQWKQFMKNNQFVDWVEWMRQLIYEWNGAPSSNSCAASEWIKLNFSFSRCARRKVDLMNGGLFDLFKLLGYGLPPLCRTTTPFH